MQVGETLLFESREAWSTWLAEHHRAKAEIWLISYKKGSGKHALDYDATLDEALCFGWIDGQIKSINADSFVTRWCPRRPRSNWSATNRARARRLIEAGLMAQAGVAALPPDLRVELGLDPPRGGHDPDRAADVCPP
jgi:uncharacterized protein YdeI (YjbR/CyaY-like superfamily)